MKRINELKDKHVLVLGIAKSGFAASQLLKKVGANVTVNDQVDLVDNPLAQQLVEMGFRVVTGEHPLHLLDGVQLIVKNPGIPYRNPLLVEAQKRGIPIITEVELAYYICEAPIIGITGSNGKTTTTMLIFEMLKEGNKHPKIAGNIGTVSCEVAQEITKEEVMVTELSSFQLMGTIDFKPAIGVLLNIFDAHLDYHSSKEEYIKAKVNLFVNQTKEDYAVLNVDSEEILAYTKELNSTIVPFSTEKKVDGGYIEDGGVYFKGERIIDIEDIVLPGKHNLENILAAISVCKLYGVDNDAIIRVLTTFQGVTHRLQYVKVVNGRRFYNDSKATNMLATQMAINAFHQPVVLIAGGLDRGNTFDDLIPHLKRLKGIVTYGQTAEKLVDAATTAGLKMIRRVNNLEEAVNEAYGLSEEGDVVLLSPACASWDQFKTFEQRGDMFVQFVNTLV
ncbi:MAG: UDP-N-acetylmuramoyl-L-alanine--D-glutamate ligase [Bacillaceae bacterium]